MKVNTESCEYIVNKYKNLVYKLARRLNYGNALYEDLVQAGFMGLIYASNKFDFTKNTNFISFASIYIVSEMKKENSKSSIFKTGILPSGNNSSNAFVKRSTVSYSEFER